MGKSNMELKIEKYCLSYIDTTIKGEADDEVWKFIDFYGALAALDWTYLGVYVMGCKRMTPTSRSAISRK